MSFPVRLTRDDMKAFDTLDLLPLRQTVRAAGEPASRFRGPGALDRFSRPDRFRILGDGPAGQILARNGAALAEAQRVLRQAYGCSIDFETPTAHSVTDQATGTLLVPVMFLRVEAPRAYRRELLQILAARSTPPGEIAVQRDRIVVRMESPLAHLIGLERQVLDHTNGAAHIVCCLAGYRPACGAGLEGAQSRRSNR